MMIGALAATTSQLIYGTAVAGFGFSLGKGVFREFKNYWQVIVAVVVFAGAIVLPVISVSKVSRWYPISTVNWFFKKFFLWLIVSGVGLGLITGIVSVLSQDTMIVGHFKSWLLTIGLIEPSQPSIEVAIIFSLLIWSLLSLLGFVHGFYLRKKRKLAYELECLNQQFLDEQGIREIDGADSFTHVDSAGEKLRFTSLGRDAAEFFVVGSRNKRAYILLDELGRFTHYSGIVSL